MPEPSAFEVELAIEKQKVTNHQVLIKSPAELIKAGDKTICQEIHKLIVSIWNKEELPEEWKESIIVPIYTKGDKTDCNNYRGISLLPTTYKILSNIIINVDLDGTDQLLTIYSAFIKYLRKSGNTTKQCISSL